MKNLYYAPKDFGLEVVDSLETKGRSYEFDIVLVLRDAHGNHFWTQDAGCSCPTPFEGHSLESLDRLTMANWEYFETHVHSACRDYDGLSCVDPSDFLTQVETSLKKHRVRPLDAYR